jgi:hypothetical protein
MIRLFILLMAPLIQELIGYLYGRVIFPCGSSDSPELKRRRSMQSHNAVSQCRSTKTSLRGAEYLNISEHDFCKSQPGVRKEKRENSVDIIIRPL